MAWPVGFVVALVVVVVGFFVLERRQRDNAWNQLASEVGGQFIPGGVFGSSEVKAGIQKWTLTLDSYSIPSGDSSVSYTRLRASLQNKDGLQFSIFRENLGRKLEKALGGQDLEIGIPDFDDAFVVRGSNAVRLQALLMNAKVRELIQAQPKITLTLKGDELRYEAQGVIKDVPRLKSLFELFGELLNRLEG